MTALYPLPAEPFPIVSIGAGGIVRNAHLPAYRMGNLSVIAVVDRDLERARSLGKQYGIPVVATSVEEVLPKIQPHCIFDVALPAKAILEVLAELPRGANVLIQKPMGETLAEAEAILAMCRARQFTAAVNFQLRWAPNMLAARNLFDRGVLGTLHDMEVQVSTHTPWELWPFLKATPRLEIVYHSVHYIDLVRSWLGDPKRVLARTVRNPRTPELAATKSVIVLDYGEWMRAYIATDHAQTFSKEHQHSYVQWEGTQNAMRARMGVNLDYPAGLPDTLELFRDPDIAVNEGGSEQTKVIPISGNWFPDAFLGSMASLQRFAAGESSTLPTSVEDAIHTMRVVEAAYLSSEHGGEPLPAIEDQSAVRKEA